MSDMNAGEWAFAKLVYGVELVLNYNTGMEKVRIADQAILRRVDIRFIA